jgi:hypothetical protein
MGKDAFQRTIHIRRLEEQAGISDHFRRSLTSVCNELDLDEAELLEEIGMRLLLTKPENFEKIGGRFYLVLFVHREGAVEHQFSVFFTYDPTMRGSSRRFNLIVVGIGQPSDEVIRRYRAFSSG